jgi:hypothetical protein
MRCGENLVGEREDQLLRVCEAGAVEGRLARGCDLLVGQTNDSCDRAVLDQDVWRGFGHPEDRQLAKLGSSTRSCRTAA